MIKKGCFRVLIKIFIGLIFIGSITYCLAVFTNIPVLSTMRNIWIETAMTTADHQWLATKFIPKFVIDEVMSNKIEDSGQITVTEIKKQVGLDKSTGIQYDISDIVLEKSDVVSEEPLLDKPLVDEFGNKIIVDDLEQGIKIIEVKTVSYTGRIVFIDDPSRVFVAHTDNKGSRGELILNYLEKYDAIVGINANGFIDFEGKGLGGEIIGCSISNGELWSDGGYFSQYTTVGFDEENRLVVGKIKDPSDYNLRDVAQFKPALIQNGEVLIKGTAGWGLQPRTIVAQREDGVVMFLVVDGRKPGYSIGITMGEAAELLYKYGAVTAAACDGGSSSVLAYNGEIINKPSTPMVTGRYLPNAFLVKSKK